MGYVGGNLTLSRIAEKDYVGLKSSLDHLLQGNLGIPENPRVLNIGGINPQENEALYKTLGGAVIDVMDVDEKLLKKLPTDYVHRKIHTNATNMPILYLGGLRYDIIFSRHPPVINSETNITRDGVKNAPTKRINIWESVLRQMHFGNPGGLTLMTFYRENEYRYALGTLAKHRPLKHGKNPRRTVFSKLDSRALFEAGMANQKDIEIIRDNYYLLAKNTCTNPVISDKLTLFIDKNDSLTSEFGDTLKAFLKALGRN